jgi:hypothetical protein
MVASHHATDDLNEKLNMPFRISISESISQIVSRGSWHSIKAPKGRVCSRLGHKGSGHLSTPYSQANPGRVSFADRWTRIARIDTDSKTEDWPHSDLVRVDP